MKLKTLFTVLAMMMLSGFAFSAVHNIDIAGFAFSPDTLTINVGDSVVWTNQDTAPHTATTDDGGMTFDSGTLTTGMSWGIVLNTPGSYPYHCEIHPAMTAMITVQAPEPVPGLGFVGLLILCLLIIGSGLYAMCRKKTRTVYYSN
ncbi:MAG: cupredoxin family copper-binding protein [candidate division Zixibacteria bacterium]|nr:cupredoxin family copper-binding protein [candidate division Zixibacteria bacterium]